MRFVVFRTREEQAVGLQFRERIDDETIFIFPGVLPGAVFHSRNVREPFDIAFLSADYRVLAKETVEPEGGVAVAPAGTALAIEAREGLLGRHGVRASA